MISYVSRARPPSILRGLTVYRCPLWPWSTGGKGPQNVLVLRDERGVRLPDEPKVSSFDFIPDQRLFLTLGVGIGGAP